MYLTLTQKGLDLEKQLSRVQISKLRDILKNSDEKDINSYKKILFSLIDTNEKKNFNKLNK